MRHYAWEEGSAALALCADKRASLNAASPSSATIQLRRTIGPTQMAFYALGSMLGSGIYGLIGQAAGQAGNAVWLSFLVAMVAALLTAFTYASLGSRYPRAGGAAYVVERAFSSPLLGFVIGLAVVCSGVASVATQAQVFARNLVVLFDLTAIPVPLMAGGFLLVLAGVVLRGIRKSMWLNILCTCIEAAGLLIIVGTGNRVVGQRRLPGSAKQRHTTGIQRRPHRARRHAGDGAHLLCLHRFRGHDQRRRGMP